MARWWGETEHQRQKEAVTQIAANIYERTCDMGSIPAKHHAEEAERRRVARSPTVLKSELPDSRFRYMLFCLSTVLAVCAHRMKYPDAVFNECTQNAVEFAKDSKVADGFFIGPVDRQKSANEGWATVRSFLDRWNQWIDVEKSDAQAAMRLVCSMIHDTESSSAATEDDIRRLWPLACWIVSMFSGGTMEKAFMNLAR